MHGPCSKQSIIFLKQNGLELLDFETNSRETDTVFSAVQIYHAVGAYLNSMSSYFSNARNVRAFLDLFPEIL